MAKWSLRFGGVHLTAGSAGDEASIDPETPFRILVLGNFSGSGRVPDHASLGQRKPLLVDRDNFDEVIAKLGVAVKIPLGPQPEKHTVIAFRDMDDFEPDRLYQKLDVFEALADLRQRLHDPAQFAAAAAEIKGWSASANIPEPMTPPTPPAPVAAENLLEQILGETAPLATPSVESDWQRFLHKIVAPHLAARTDPRLPDFETVLDEAASAHMRGILHHPAFQAVEAAWRGLFFLMRRLETDSQLKLYILDVTGAELAADLSVDDLNQSGTFRQLVENTVGTPGAAPWAVICGLYTFGPSQHDLELLGNLGRLASLARAPFLAGAQSQLLGCASLVRQPDPREWNEQGQDLWQQLRQLAEANFIGLALPRLLLRLPYGKEGRATEQFAFEEMPVGSPHEYYLWGNPALALTVLLGQSFSQWGWNLRPGKLQDVDGLPVHIFQEDDERQSKPCAEVLLSNRAFEHILDQGLMPLVSLPGKDTIRAARFQSIASPPAPLAGRWQTP